MLRKAIIVFVFIDVLAFVGLSALFVSKYKTNVESVKGAQAPTPTLTLAPTITPTPTITPAPTRVPLSKQTYTIAIFGDSMVDTMGENLEYLDRALKVKYPGTHFKLYNYGIGSQNIEQGLARFNQPFLYKTRNYPAITEINADIIVLGSFAYNPLFPHDRNKHYLLLGNLVQETKKTSAKVYLLAEIAPIGEGFGQGPHGPNMARDAAYDQANRIIEQLENTFGVAKNQGIPLINVFSETQVNGKYGSKFDTNPDDGIHPSVAGHQLIASKIVSTIVLK